MKRKLIALLLLLTVFLCACSSNKTGTESKGELANTIVSQENEKEEGGGEVISLPEEEEQIPSLSLVEKQIMPLQRNILSIDFLKTFETRFTYSKDSRVYVCGTSYEGQEYKNMAGYIDFEDGTSTFFEPESLNDCWGLIVNGDGNIVLIDCGITESGLCVFTEKEYSEKGELVDKKRIISDKSSYVRGIINAEGGYLVETDLGATIFDSDWNSGAQIAFEEGHDRLLVGKENRIFEIYHDDNDDVYCASFDTATGKRKNPVKIDLHYSRLDFFQDGVLYDFLVADMDVMYGVDMEKASISVVADYLESNMKMGGILEAIYMDERLCTLVQEYAGPDTVYSYAATITKASEVKEKKRIVVGNLNPYVDVRDEIIEFNLSNEEYKAVLKDYSKYVDKKNQEGDIKALGDDIEDGKAPDILVMSNGAGLQGFAADGLLLDLTNRFKEDKEVEESKIFDSVVKAGSYDGKLYSIIPSFYVETVISSDDALRDFAGWNAEEFVEYISSHKTEDKLDIYTNFVGEDKSTWFDEVEIFDALNEYDDILLSGYIESVSSLWYLEKEVLNEELAIVGYPIEDKKGSFLGYHELYGITSFTNEEEGAWEFIKKYLLSDYQKKVHSFPASSEVCRGKFKDEGYNDEASDGYIALLNSIDKDWVKYSDINAPISTQLNYYVKGQKSKEAACKDIEKEISKILDK